MIYFDNAATSWPKPPCVAEAMTHYLAEIGANPGRSGHRLAVAAARVVYGAREAVAELLRAPDPLRVVFGANATEALNLALSGLLRPGDHAVTGSMEHNSVMRPLRALERTGVQVTAVPCTPEGSLDPGDLAAAVRPNTRLIALTHAIDLLAFSGHKSLYGPMGTGGLVIGERVDAGLLTPLKRGGTGSRSEHEEQPEFLPDLCESGTPNAVGLAGLAAGTRWVLAQGVERIREHELALTGQLLAGLAAIPGVTIYGPRDARRQTATVSFKIAGLETSEIGLRLDDEFAILCRVGLHCAPPAHRTLGTFPAGTVRFGMGAFNTAEQVAAALNAVAALAQEAR